MIQTKLILGLAKILYTTGTQSSGTTNGSGLGSVFSKMADWLDSVRSDFVPLALAIATVGVAWAAIKLLAPGSTQQDTSAARKALVAVFIGLAIYFLAPNIVQGIANVLQS